MPSTAATTAATQVRTLSSTLPPPMIRNVASATAASA